MKSHAVLFCSILLACLTGSSFASQQAITVNLTVHSPTPANNFSAVLTLLDPAKKPQISQLNKRPYHPPAVEFGDNDDDLQLYKIQGYSQIQLSLAQINGVTISNKNCSTPVFNITDLLTNPVTLSMTANADKDGWKCVIQCKNGC